MKRNLTPTGLTKATGQRDNRPVITDFSELTGEQMKRLKAELASSTPGNAYGYARVSHRNSLERNESIPAQRERIKRYYEAFLQPEGVSWKGVYDDKTNISAFKTRFVDRPAGRELVAILQPGDHLIIDKIDRLWRNLRDFCELMDTFRNKNITVHIQNFLGQPLLNNSTLGEFSLRIFVMLAELESAVKSERTCEALAIRRKAGRITGARTFPGTKLKIVPNPNGDKPLKYLIWDEKERELMKVIVDKVVDEKMNYLKATPFIIEALERLYGKKYRGAQSKSLIDDRENVWPRLLAYESAYRYLNIQEPAQIPKVVIIKEAARQYRRMIGDKTAKFPSKVSTIPKITPEQLLQLAERV